MKPTSDRSRRTAPRLLVSCLCCLALSPLAGAEKAAGQAAPVPALTAAEQAAADALIAKHGNAVFAHYPQVVGKDAQVTFVLNTIEYLVSKGADVHAKAKNGNTLLHMAAYGKNPELVKYAVSLGLDVNAKNNPGNTPLHLAARLNENVEVAKYLVENGADVHAKNNRGGTPLHDAAKENKNAEVFDFLVSKGADADAADNGGLTPRSLKPQPRPAAPQGW